MRLLPADKASVRRLAVCAAAALLLASGRLAAETTVTGLEEPELANVLAYLAIDDLDCDAEPAVVARALDDVVAEATAALNVFGFYAPQIETQLTDGEVCWLAAIRIDPGEPVRLRNIDISVTGPATELTEFASLTANPGLAAGNLLRHADYDNLKRRLQDLARNRGFAEASFTTSRIDIYPEQLAADVELEFVSGPRYRVGQVTVNQSELDPEFVAAFYDLAPGLLYDNRLLTTAFLDLNNSGYFSAVEVRALPADPESRTIPVQIDLSPAARRVISYGVGISTDTGPRLRIGRTIRRFNPRGHQLSIEGQVSPVISEITSIYRMPLDDPRSDWLNFNLGAKREETETSLTRSIEAGVRRIVDRSRGWSLTQFISFAFEDFEVGSQNGRPHLLIPGVDWSRLRGDDALRPTNGSKLDFEVRAANDSFLSDTSFFETTASIKWIRTVTTRGRLLLRGRAGYLAEETFHELPPSVRFFAGGDTSIRGFDFESLGPVDEDGHVIGGNRLLEASIEYEHEIRPRWSLAIFADSGNAFFASDFHARTGAGLGARWRSPLGPVRIDVAWPVNDVESGPRLHISLGPDL